MPERRPRRVVTLARAVDRFIATEAANGKSDRTLRHYEAILGYLMDELGADADPFQITEDDLLDAFASWRRLASTTRANRRSVVGSFFAWLARRYDVDDPSLTLARPKKRPGVRPRLSPADLEALLIEAAKSPRDLVLVATLAMTGMRRAELLGLRWRDVDTDQRIVRVTGKGGKAREIPIPHALARILGEHRARQAEHGHAAADHYVCPRRYEYQAGQTGIREARTLPDEPMGVTTPGKVLRRLAHQAGLDRVPGPHDLRRAYATTFLVANPGDIYRLQAILGHDDIGTTRIYLASVELRDAREAVDRVEFVTPEPGQIVTGREPAHRTDHEPPAPGGEERTTGLEPAERSRDDASSAGGNQERSLVTPPKAPLVRPPDDRNTGGKP